MYTECTRHYIRSTVPNVVGVNVIGIRYKLRKRYNVSVKKFRVNTRKKFKTVNLEWQRVPKYKDRAEWFVKRNVPEYLKQREVGVEHRVAEVAVLIGHGLPAHVVPVAHPKARVHLEEAGKRLHCERSRAAQSARRLVLCLCRQCTHD